MAKKKEAPVESTDSAEAGGKKSSSKKFVIVGALLLAAGVGVGTKLSPGSAAPGTTVLEVKDHSTTTSIDPLKKLAVPLDPLVVYLEDGNYLKVDLTITIAPEEPAGEEAVDVEKMKPLFDGLKDEARTYLDGRSTEEVLADGFSEKFKQHLLERGKLEFDEQLVNIDIPAFIPSPA